MITASSVPVVGYVVECQFEEYKNVKELKINMICKLKELKS